MISIFQKCFLQFPSFPHTSLSAPFFHIVPHPSIRLPYYGSNKNKTMHQNTGEI